MYYSSELDKYFNEIEDFMLEYLNLFDSEEDLPPPDLLPSSIVECLEYNADRLPMPNALEVVEKILDDAEARKRGAYYCLYHANSAVGIVESVEENFYNDAQDDLQIPPWYGLDRLQDALDLFIEVNTFVWLVLARFRWYQPRYSLGILALQRALHEFKKANQHHVLYYPTNNKVTSIDRQDWIDLILDL
jgi:hypothetical protein